MSRFACALGAIALASAMMCGTVFAQSSSSTKMDSAADAAKMKNQMGAKRQTAATASKEILYYRNPMGMPDTSPVPKKDSMGMDYIPVYEMADCTKQARDQKLKGKKRTRFIKDCSSKPI